MCKKGDQNRAVCVRSDTGHMKLGSGGGFFRSLQSLSPVFAKNYDKLFGSGESE